MVYAELWMRSPECKLWNCRWLGNDDMDELRRPDRSHYVVDIMPDFVRMEHDGEIITREVVQIWCDPDYPDAHRDPALRAWLERHNVCGLVRYDNARPGVTIIPPQMMDNGRWLERTSNLTQEKPHSFAQIVAAIGGAR
jgi:hypothetical protein